MSLKMNALVFRSCYYQLPIKLKKSKEAEKEFILQVSMQFKQVCYCFSFDITTWDIFFFILVRA